VLALLYDMHGNLRAFRAVLADARAAGATWFLLGGDYAAFGAEPVETLAELRALDDAVWIRGNWERWCAHPEQALDNPVVQGALRAVLAALDEATVAQLGALPTSAVLDGTRYCHGSPRSDMDSFLPEPQDGEEDLLEDATEHRIVFGHTHLQFTRSTAGVVELVNPGSVGFPLDGDTRAAYALVDDEGAIELRRVDYDVEAAAGALLERYAGEEWAAATAERLRAARF
jgi:diadenosine tetraphosphatase ApaH/serine/threonine PP2A family protein phosphatase